MEIRDMNYSKDVEAYCLWGFHNLVSYFDYHTLFDELTKDELHSAFFGYWYCNVRGK